MPKIFQNILCLSTVKKNLFCLLDWKIQPSCIKGEISLPYWLWKRVKKWSRQLCYLPWGFKQLHYANSLENWGQSSLVFFFSMWCKNWHLPLQSESPLDRYTSRKNPRAYVNVTFLIKTLIKSKENTEKRMNTKNKLRMETSFEFPKGRRNIFKTSSAIFSFIWISFGINLIITKLKEVEKKSKKECAKVAEKWQKIRQKWRKTKVKWYRNILLKFQ